MASHRSLSLPTMRRGPASPSLRLTPEETSQVPLSVFWIEIRGPRPRPGSLESCSEDPAVCGPLPEEPSGISAVLVAPRGLATNRSLPPGPVSPGRWGRPS